jgi:enoyl-CoA hydratase
MFHRDARGDVARLRFAHKKASALDLEFLEALEVELRETESSRARALVLTGTDKIFSAGVDLFRILGGGRDYIAQFLPALERVCLALLRFRKPLVAAINGHAIAGGCVIACACDARLLTRGRATIGVPELRVGVPFPPAALEILRCALAPHVLRAAVVSADAHPPEQALAKGFVDELVDPEQLDERAFAVAERMAEIHPESFTHTKALLRRPAEDFLERHAEARNAEVLEHWSSVATLAAIRRYVDATLGPS